MTTKSILGPDGQPVASTPSLNKPKSATTGWRNVYEAADRADFRGFFYLPSLNPSVQQDSWTRRTIIERSDWLYKNVPAISMVIDGLAVDEVGSGLWPKWTTSEPKFNKWMTDAFHYANHDPRVFSADGNNDVYSAQYNVRRMIRLYGDCFGQLLRPAPGSTLPSMHLIPGYRVDGGPGGQTGWRDGIRTNPLGRALEYNIIPGESPFAGDASSMTVLANDMLHFHDPFLPGQVRGMPILAAVAKRMFTREDILRALTNGTLVRERIGFAIQRKDDDEPVMKLPGGGEIEEVANPDGSKYTVQKIFGEHVRDEVDIPEITAGEIKMFESNRPGTQVTEFLENILRELAYVTKYPPEYLFFLSGMGQGTVARLVLQKRQALVNNVRAFQIGQMCHRFNVFWAWQQIANNGVPKGITIPEDWWKHKLLADADMSVDLGREGRLLDDRFMRGNMSPERYHALNGEDAEEVEDEVIAAAIRRHQKLTAALKGAPGVKLDYEQVFLPPPGTANNNQSSEPDPIETDEPPAPPKKS